MTGATSFFKAALFVAMLGCALAGFSQNSTPPQGTPTPSAPAGDSTGRGRPPAADRPLEGMPEMPRPIYLSGRVRLPDGSPPPSTVVIERVCGATNRPEGYTDSEGHFSFIVANQSSGVFLDASVSSEAAARSPASGRQRNLERELVGCELRGNLPGFISDSVVLGFRHGMENPDVGTIRLRPLENVEGYTFSITTALASKDARKAYDKGLEDVKKQKWTEAERDFAKAVEAYPKYAIAWYELGNAYHRQKKYDEARRAYRQALQIDSRFISPYGQLIALNASQRQWQDVVEDSSKMLQLNPYVGAEIYFYSAVAHYNLKKVDVAEERAAQAAKLDAQHKIPKINHLLGVILAEKGDYVGAGENIRTYLKFSPNATDAQEVRQLLADVEKENRGQ